MPKTLFFLIAFLLPNVIANAVTITGSESGIELVKKLATVRAETLAKAGPYVAQVDQNTSLSLTSAHVGLKMEFVEQRNGNLQSVTRVTHGSKTMADLGEQIIEDDERLIVGDKDISYWHVGNTFAYIWPNIHYDLLPNIARVTLDGTHARDLMKYTFGWGSFNFESLVENMNQGKQVIAEVKSRAGNIITLNLTVGEPASPDYLAELKIDSNQGYLVTSALMYDGEDQFMEFVLVSGKEYESGIWLPENWQHDLYDYRDENGVKECVTTDHSVSKLTSLKLHQQFEPTIFTPLGLSLPNGTRVLSGNSTESMQLSVFDSGSYVSPAESAARN